MKTYLGLDLSTQQLKIVATNDSLEFITEVSVHFDSDLPEFGTKGGAIIADDKLTVTVPTLLWVKAMDLCFGKLKNEKFDFKNVAAISGTGQQHGSVYWKRGSHDTLSNLNPNKSWSEQLVNCFSVENSPIWMDSSTLKECKELENNVGGEENLVEITGSRAYERFTGNQIKKIYKNQPEAYHNTERISLVSSFACSLLVGKYANIDFSDGSGMNLLDIRKKEWNSDCLKSCGDEKLAEKLGKPVSSTKVIGSVSSYMVERYGFSPSCKVVAFTGDNPASLAGCRLQKGDAMVSLGTSDTLVLYMDEPIRCLQGHVFVNPLDDNAYMGMICFKNGSLTRERFRDNFTSNKSWQEFSQALKKTPNGNNGKFGFYYDVQEILPNANGDHRFDSNDKKVDNFTNEENIRSLIEGQLIAKKYYSEKIGHKIIEGSKILATGGASNNKEILQVLSDVFKAPVYILNDTANSAALGCAYRAKHGLLKESNPSLKFSEIFTKEANYTKSTEPISDYQYDLSRYEKLENIVVNS